MPEVRPSSFLTNAPSPDVFGAQLFGTVARITGDIANRMAQEARTEADEMAILVATNELSAFGVERRYGSKGWQLQLGFNAFDIPRIELEALNKRADEITEGLTTSRQRQFFLRARTQFAMRLELETTRHVSTQMDVERRRQTSSAIQFAIDEAVAHATGDERDVAFIASRLESIGTLTRSQCERDGKPVGSPACDALLLANRSEVHHGVISRMIDNGHMTQAQDYFDEVSGARAAREEPEGKEQQEQQLTTPAMLDLTKKLRMGSVRSESQRLGDIIMDTSTSITEARAMAREIENAEVRAATVINVARRWEERRTEEIRQHQDDMQVVAQKIFKDGVGTVTSDEWASMTAAEIDQFERFAVRNATTGGVVTNLEAYYAQSEMSIHNKELFADFDKNNLYEQASLYSHADLMRLINRQQQIAEGLLKPETQALMDDEQTQGQIIGDVLDTAEIFGKKERSEVRQMFSRRVSALARRNAPAKVSNDDMRDIARDTVFGTFTIPGQGDLPGFLPGFNALFGQGNRKAVDRLLRKIVHDDIPPVDLLEVQQNLTTMGLKHTKALELEFYIAGLVRDRDKLLEQRVTPEP